MPEPSDRERDLAGGKPPLHGFQGDRGPRAEAPGPRRLCVAVSREAGARGGTIGRRVARKLGWQVYDQELLEYLAQEPTARQRLLEGLAAADLEWVEGRLRELLPQQEPGPQVPAEGAQREEQGHLAHLVRVILALGLQGEVVLIGRGAGSILPRATTLNVRVIAPLEDRIAYMSQLMRLSREEAAERVRLRDQRRSEFLSAHFGRQPGDLYQYDLLLNSSELGEEVCAELIAQAARARAEEGREG